MPKQSFKIVGFHGGLNNDADPRDIRDDEFSELQGVRVDKVGKMVNMGVTQGAGHLGGDGTGGASQTIKINPGYGQFFTSSDRTGGCYANIENIGTQWTYPGSMSENRIYTENKHIVVDSQSTSANKILVSSDVAINGYVSAYKAFSDQQANVGAGLVESVFTNIDNNLIICDGQVNNWSNESQWIGHRVSRPWRDSGYSPAVSGWSWGYTALTGPSDGDLIVNNNVSDLNANPNNYFVPPNVDMINVGLWQYTGTGEVAGSGWNNSFTIGVSTIYDNHNDSPIKAIGTQVPMNGTSNHSDVGAWVMIGARPFGPNGEHWNRRITGFKVWLKETGEKTYWFACQVNLREGVVLSDGVDGSASQTGGGSQNWTGGGTASQERMYCNSKTMAIPPKLRSYRDVTGLDQRWPADVAHDARYKTAVAANRRLYVGNVHYSNEANMGIKKADGMIKSPVNAFGTLSGERLVEVSTGDGDEITVLQEYADRILQFKKNKLHIINISQDVEFLEDTYHFKGAYFPAAVTKTDFGCAWINQHGAYMYDGQKIINLFEKDGQRRISKSDWDSFYSDGHSMIGYFPKRRALLICASCKSGYSRDVYYFDMITQSWTYGKDIMPEGNKTNFANDWLGNLCVTYNAGGNAASQFFTRYWDGNPSDQDLLIVTKDIDLGDPSRRKKMYKFYITYKSGGDIPTLTYAIDGSDTYNSFTTVTALGSNKSDWTLAEYKFGSAANNARSVKVKLSGQTSKEFEVNDLSIIYRSKGIK